MAARAHAAVSAQVGEKVKQIKLDGWERPCAHRWELMSWKDLVPHMAPASTSSSLVYPLTDAKHDPTHHSSKKHEEELQGIRTR